MSVAAKCGNPGLTMHDRPLVDDAIESTVVTRECFLDGAGSRQADGVYQESGHLERRLPRYRDVDGRAPVARLDPDASHLSSEPCSLASLVIRLNFPPRQIGQMSKPTIPTDITSDAVAMLEATFEIDHHARPDASELLTSPWLSKDI